MSNDPCDERSLRAAGEVDTRALYLDLLERALLHTLYTPIDTAPLPEHVVEALRKPIAEMLARGQSLTVDPLQVRLAGAR